MFVSSFWPLLTAQELNIFSHVLLQNDRYIFKVAGYSFQYFSRLKSLMGHYNHSIPVDAKIMVSTSCPIIGEQVAGNFVAE